VCGANPSPSFPQQAAGYQTLEETNEGIHWHDISDEARERIKELLPGQARKHEGAAKDNRLFISAADAHGRSVEGYIA
jgi:hypothetical protein